MAIVLKIKYQEQTYRVKMQQQRPKSISYHADIVPAIQKALPQLSTFTAKYLDDEGDLCTLSQDTVADFLSFSTIAADQKVVKLTILNAEEGVVEVAHEDEAMSGHIVNGVSGISDAADTDVITTEKSGMSTQNKDRSRGGKGKHFFKGKGKGKWNPHMVEAVNASADESGISQCWMLKTKKMLWLLCCLKAEGVLSSGMVAGLALHYLPKLIDLVSKQGQKVDCKFHKKHHKIKLVLQDLHTMALETPALEPCVDTLASLAAGNVVSPSHALLHVFTTLNDMPRGSIVGFIEAFYATQAEGITKMVNHMESRLPRWFANRCWQHAGIACGGCGMSPLKGPRFTSLTCPDFDMCGECFARNVGSPGVECRDHQFMCKLFDSHAMWKNQESQEPTVPPCPWKLWHMKSAFKGSLGWCSNMTEQKGKGHIAGWWLHKLAVKGKGKGKGCFSKEDGKEWWQASEDVPAGGTNVTAEQKAERAKRVAGKMKAMKEALSFKVSKAEKWAAKMAIKEALARQMHEGVQRAEVRAARKAAKRFGETVPSVGVVDTNEFQSIKLEKQRKRDAKDAAKDMRKAAKAAKQAAKESIKVAWVEQKKKSQAAKARTKEAKKTASGFGSDAAPHDSVPQVFARDRVKCAHPCCRFAVHSRKAVSKKYCCKACESCASQDSSAAPRHGGRCEAKICCMPETTAAPEEQTHSVVRNNTSDGDMLGADAVSIDAAVEDVLASDAVAAEDVSETAPVSNATRDLAACTTSEGAWILQEMGFGDAADLHGWVVACNGDLEKVVEILTQ